jgi:PA14 domain.
MIKVKLDSNTVFSALLAILFIIIVNKITPPSVDGVIELVLMKSRSHITSIDQTRSISDTRSILIDEVNLYDKDRFFHPKLGLLGWSNDFFAEINTDFTVKEKGGYRFLVGSDDGFALEIDGKRICSFSGDRAYSKQVCRVTLDQGDHQLKLSYFQGYGNAGLTLQYQPSGKSKMRYWGENSKQIKIKKAKKKDKTQ